MLLALTAMTAILSLGMAPTTARPIIDEPITSHNMTKRSCESDFGNSLNFDFYWGQFWNTHDCCGDTSGDPSQANGDHGATVSLRDAGCLVEPGRMAFYSQGAFNNEGSYRLLFTNEGECGCQNFGVDLGSAAGCFPIDPSVNSYRIIEGPCPPNNC